MIASTATSTTTPTAFPQVLLPGLGLVSLASLDDLYQAQLTEEADLDQIKWQAAELDRHAEDSLAEAGALLVPRRASWQVPLELTPWMPEADRLVSRIGTLDERIADFDRRIGDRARSIAGWRRRLAVSQRARAGQQLRDVLVHVAVAAGEAGHKAPDAGPFLGRAAQQMARAGGLREAAVEATARLEATSLEIALRVGAIQEMGFDSLHLAAYFRANGMPAIGSPIHLEMGEVAHLTVAAGLTEPPAARPEGGPVPVALTGLPTWVGSFHVGGMSASPGGLMEVGTLVVTNERLALVTESKLAALPLAKVIDLDVFDDGLRVIQSGAGEPLCARTASPRMVAFYVNWARALL